MHSENKFSVVNLCLFTIILESVSYILTCMCNSLIFKRREKDMHFLPTFSLEWLHNLLLQFAAAAAAAVIESWKKGSLQAGIMGI